MVAKLDSGEIVTIDLIDEIVEKLNRAKKESYIAIYDLAMKSRDEQYVVTAGFEILRRLELVDEKGIIPNKIKAIVANSLMGDEFDVEIIRPNGYECGKDTPETKEMPEQISIDIPVVGSKKKLVGEASGNRLSKITVEELVEKKIQTPQTQDSPSPANSQSSSQSDGSTHERHFTYSPSRYDTLSRGQSLSLNRKPNQNQQSVNSYFEIDEIQLNSRINNIMSSLSACFKNMSCCFGPNNNKGQ